ncbi:MAG TPA: hypothetical protein VGS57_01665 [Thermoanaerobaculia bacterium]|jgi:hypothetical protein|nr:hypothetical protein [Thermoanaerobaculia bacterium]
MTQPSYAPPPPPAPPPSALPGWARAIGLGCGALLLLGVVAGSVFFVFMKKATAGPEKTVKEFLAAAGRGDFSAAYDYFSSDLKTVQSLEQFTAEAAAHQRFFQVQETTFNNRSIDLQRAELSGSVTLTDGSVKPASFKLTKERGEWKLTSYQLGSG